MNIEEELSKVEYDKRCKVHGINTKDLRDSIKTIEEIPLIFTDIVQSFVVNHKRNTNTLFSEIQDVNCWIRKINYLIHGINESIIYSLDIIDKDNYRFFPFSRNTEDDKCYFHIENAEYRLIIMWDTLAQLYNMFFKMGKSIHKIHYKQIFYNKNCKMITMNKRFNLENNRIDILCKKQFMDICSYIKEDIKYNEENGECKGNNKYLSEERNSFTHRKNPHELSFLNSSKESLNLPEAPLHITKRLVEDYIKLYKYINGVLYYYKLYFKSKGID